MSLAEGIQARIAYKAHSSGAITPGTEPVPSSNPGATDAQILRRVSSTLTLSKDTYQSAEVRTDRQIVDFRHGTRRVQGNIAGELSAGTYGDLFEALFRGTWSAAVSLDETDLTSAAADNATSKFTFAGGDPVSEGLRIGDIIRFTNLSAAGNNGVNFLITGFGGTSNREVTVYPAPTTHTADTSFSLVSMKRLSVPSSSFVSRLFAFEIYNEDIDVARLFTECRIGSASLSLPATGMSTVEFGVMGRNQAVYSGGSAPFFTNPTAATTTGVFAAVNGLLRVGNTAQAVVTGVDISVDLSPTADAVVGSNLVPEIFLGRANVTGTVTAFFEDGTLIGNFIGEDEVSLLLKLDASSDPSGDAMALYLPRIKLGGADVATQGEGGQLITLPFQALKYVGSGAGIEQTAIQIVDTAVA